VLQQSREGQWSQTELQLQQHHLAWLLEGIAVAARHAKQWLAAASGQPGPSSNPSSDAMATCALLAADILVAAAQQPHQNHQNHQNQQGGEPPYLPAALHILVHTGDLLNPQTLGSIVPALTQLQVSRARRRHAAACSWRRTRALPGPSCRAPHRAVARGRQHSRPPPAPPPLPQARPTCAAHVVATTAHFGPVQPPPAALFSATLLERHWALGHAAMESLVVYARSSSSDFRAVIPQQLFGGPEQQQQFVARLRWGSGGGGRGARGCAASCA
jgi:hypothetical protein